MIRKLLGVAAIFMLAIATSCSEARLVGDYAAPSPTFESPDSGAEAAAPEPGSVAMCPVTTCTLPWATCSSSEFPCSTDLSNDRDNCGGCGIRCGDGAGDLGKNWGCVNGQCTFGCHNGSGSRKANCDGDPTNGCEANVDDDPNNCGDCGLKCANGELCAKGQCVDPCKLAGLPDTCSGRCTNLSRDDGNCGTCGTACDPTGPGAPPLPPDMYYGCNGGTCGRRKCVSPNTLDCNNDPSDGCEVTVHTDDHCNGCNDACPAGKHCRLRGKKYVCECQDDRMTLCGFFCVDLDSDVENCGGCNRVCPGLDLSHSVATCTFGVCSSHCASGYADCDGIADNGCEVNTQIDNGNCGTCGHGCLPDQVCSGGKCLVAPCDAGAGDPTK
jgi:hypothetical protein